MYPSRFLKAADIGDGERVLTISGVVFEAVGEDREMKPVVYFNGEKRGLVMNKTNALRLEYIAGSDDTDDWVGLEITLYTELVSFGGKSGPAIRIKNTRPLNPMTAAGAKTLRKAMDDPPPWVDEDIPA
jgi:hypothetical protein